MTANIRANPFVGLAQLNARPSLPGPTLFRQELPVAPKPAVINAPLVSTSIRNTGGVGITSLPDTTQYLVSTLGVPTLVSYLGGSRKSNGNPSNPFKLDESAPSYEGEAEDWDFTGNTGSITRPKRQLAVIEPDKENPFRASLNLFS